MRGLRTFASWNRCKRKQLNERRLKDLKSKKRILFFLDSREARRPLLVKLNKRNCPDKLLLNRSLLRRVSSTLLRLTPFLPPPTSPILPIAMKRVCNGSIYKGSNQIIEPSKGFPLKIKKKKRFVVRCSVLMTALQRNNAKK